jgi:hypothetical protein
MTQTELIVKKHVSGEGKLILAVCDKELLGKVFEEGKKHLDLSADFYEGETMDEDMVQSYLKKAYIINAIGKNAVGCCLKAGLIEKGSTKEILKIPYVNLIFT